MSAICDGAKKDIKNITLLTFTPINADGSHGMLVNAISFVQPGTKASGYGKYYFDSSVNSILMDNGGFYDSYNALSPVKNSMIPRDGQMFFRNAFIICTTRMDWHTVSTLSDIIDKSTEDGIRVFGSEFEPSTRFYEGIIGSDFYGFVDVDFGGLLLIDSDDEPFNGSLVLNITSSDFTCSQLNITTTFEKATTVE
ncbi:hypothetical protein L596_026396 [Steinernema carpocapsae]|uniref:Uncharacterized protein n=1 Tax=Steinernema carpocapsae TaxID=34508 RepID=A0A4U5M190_STECR|nr:hypothetical protein L596_026396 [Steinernema carpocapsae]